LIFFSQQNFICCRSIVDDILVILATRNNLQLKTMRLFEGSDQIPGSSSCKGLASKVLSVGFVIQEERVSSEIAESYRLSEVLSDLDSQILYDDPMTASLLQRNGINPESGGGKVFCLFFIFTL